jgi:hypothetical protein
LTITNHEFLSELKNHIIELEEEPHEILMLTDYPAINLLGVQIKKLENQSKYKIPYYIAYPLVLEGKAEWIDQRETHSSLLNKFVNLFRMEQRSNIIQKIDTNSIGILLLLMKELIENNGDNELSKKIDGEWRNFISQRIKKILTKYKIDGPKEIRKRLDPIEETLFNQIHLIIQIYEQFIQTTFKIQEKPE